MISKPMAGDKETPLMRQYHSIKAKHPDTVLLFRLGDFFETFGDDAIITAKVCGITLTKRNNGAAGDVPLAGFPHHQLDAYLPKLVRAGYRAAVCEQLEDPKLAKGIVKRDVVEVVTPGVALYDKLLDARRNTYVAALVLEDRGAGMLRAGIAYADASTAEFAVCTCDESGILSTLESIAPAEILIAKSQAALAARFIDALPVAPAVTRVEDWIAGEQFARETLVRHLRTHTLKGFGLDHLPDAVTAAGMVMHYISETQQGKVSHFSSVRTFDTGEYMTLDTATRRNLEIVSSSQEKDASLVTVLDDTCTPMGGRLLRSWLLRPLRSRDRINDRLHAVTALVRDQDLRRSVRDMLKRIGDLERLVGKVCVQRATPRDIVAVRMSLTAIPVLHSLCSDEMPGYLRTLMGSPEALPDLVRDIEYALVDEPALQFGSGGIFRAGHHRELDEMREALSSGKTWITAYQERLRSETGIPSLKVGMNGVFGYYVEISNTHRDRVPDSFQRRQTLANAERYITPELKEREELIMRAESGLSTLEQRLFAELRQRVADHAAAIQHAARCIAAIDCLASFASVSARNEYCEPFVADDDVIDIREGRHPVVEKLLPVGTPYVPNATRLDVDESQIHILTGPNMAGKSCYLRQVGLIVLLAHVGCWVPAASAHVSLCDRIFTRVGAQDNIATGESTFLVEMQEAANILHHATKASLVLLDEVGRG
ncbi:MAG: DNA mismatch repair protein MutS, partial [Candidatus Kapaibacterium sp.]